jgi:pimeloyl-ACP methyl ester carboxylesterase
MAPTVVLVHGAWHGPWAWDRVVPLLDAAGVQSVTVDLPSRRSAGGYVGDLHTDASAVAAEMSRHASVVLVGHSYGGAVITEAGTHPSVRHLVFLAAFPLRRDESCAHAAIEESTAIDDTGRTSLGSGFITHPDGSVTLTPTVARACLYSDLDDATAAWAVERLGHQSLAALVQSPHEVAWELTPSTYVVCGEDQAVHPDLQRILARRCRTELEWSTGHSPFLSDPPRVAALLTRLANHND